ncbi:MFS transporter [Modestobacter sp. SYSU DS0290]
MPQWCHFIDEGGPVGAADPSSGSTAGRASTAAVWTLCAVQFVDVMTTTLVIAALPPMLADLDASPTAASLVAPAYAVFFGALLVLGARLGDRFGHRRVLRLGVVGFTCASALTALAPSLVVLVVGRCLLGAAAAVSVPPALRLLLAVSHGAESRRRALAAWSASGALAGGAGLVLGGVLTDLLGWRALFWLSVALGGGLLVAVHRAVPDARRAGTRPRAGAGGTGSLDAPGAVVLTLAIASLIAGASLVQEPGRRLAGLGLVVLAAALGLLLRRVEQRSSAPLLPRAALRHRDLRTGCLVSFVNTASTSSAVILATLHLQESAGQTSTAAALGLLPFSVLVVAGSALSPRLLRPLGRHRTAAVGLAGIAVGTAALVTVPGAAWAAPVAVAVAGFGIGLSSVAATTLGTDVSEDLEATAAGLLNTAAQLGTAVGVALVLLIASTVTGLAGAPAGDVTGWLSAAAVAAALAVRLAYRRGHSCRAQDDRDRGDRDRGVDGQTSSIR